MPVVVKLQELQNIDSPTTETLLFSSQDFRAIRILLRLLSLWRPRSAGVLESYVYPVLINLLLLINGPIRNSLRATNESTWLNVQRMYIVHEVVIWLGHILGNRYFASRDLEKNVLRPIKPLTGIEKPLNRRLNVLNVTVVISMTFFSIMLCTLSAVYASFYHGAERFSSQFPDLQGPVDHILFGFILISIVYNLGIGLALFWTFALLYSCYAARLNILENIFLKWKHSSVDAISFFLQVYALPVKHSWKRISWWFLAHNIAALAIPLYGYELAQAVSGRAYHSKYLPQFICYLIFIVTIWLAPTIVGELIKHRERKFMEHINDISPWLLEAETHPLSESGDHFQLTTVNRDLPECPHQTSSLSSIGSTSAEVSDTGPKYAEYTFASRGKELKKFLQFLKGRTPGLVSRGYSIQLNLSLLSLIGGAILFLVKLHSMSSEDTMYRNRNSTMS